MDAFVARGLLTTDRENGDDVVSVAHEAFLSAWPPLVRAVAEASTALRARHGVELAAREWEETGRASERLWERGQLAAAVADTGARVLRRPGGAGGLATDRIELSETAREFLVRSIRRDRFRRGRITLVLSAFLVVALVGVLIAMRLVS